MEKHEKEKEELAELDERLEKDKIETEKVEKEYQKRKKEKFEKITRLRKEVVNLQVDAASIDLPGFELKLEETRDEIDQVKGDLLCIGEKQDSLKDKFRFLQKCSLLHNLNLDELFEKNER